MTFTNLLNQAINKQNALFPILPFHVELLKNAYPILWFGNSISEKPRILTLGANPSRWEYLNKKTGGYLTGINARFCTIMNPINYNSIQSSFNDYFKRNPYSSWFGKQATSGKPASKAEAFLNGMNASYYGTKEYNYNVCHIDLFPFTTISDFKTIEKAVAPQLFGSGWSQGFLKQLVDALNPNHIIIMGRSNCDCFENYFTHTHPNATPLIISGTTKKVTHKYYGNKSIFSAPKLKNVIGISTNLGNPMASDGSKSVGLTSQNLITFGSDIKSIYNI